MSDDTVPAGTFGDYSETNALAEEHESQYEICDRSGFRVPRGTLVKTWDGLMVRPKEMEFRHPQEFVRGRAETPRPSRSPEMPDEFLEVGDVTTDEL